MKPIGGYLELERGGFRPRHGGLAVNSGRNALRLIVRLLKIGRLHVPSYTCPVVPQAVCAEGCEVLPYDLDERLMPACTFPREDFILVNDYFGVMGENVARLAVEYPNLIVDNAQSHFAEPRGRAAFYSPRKFFGVPDGGIAVFNRDEIVAPELEVDVSCKRMMHLLKRHDLGACAAYADFRDNEAALDDAPIRAMSSLTRAILSTIDDERARRRRQTNFAVLDAALGADNLFPVSFQGRSFAALAYPYVSSDATLRQRLIDAQVFVPMYWPGCRGPSARAGDVIPLPIDQRYGEEDMNRILEVICG